MWKYEKMGLIPFNIQLLNVLMEMDGELKKILKTPYERLSPEYRYLIDETFFLSRKYTTLYDLITFICTLPLENFGEKINTFFIVEDNKIVGFFAFSSSTVIKKIVKIWNIFTFKPTPSGSIIPVERFIKLLTLILKCNCDRISFHAFQNDTKSSIFQDIVGKFGGYIKDSIIFTSLLDFIIENNK
jgi:hypothetical protein